MFSFSFFSYIIMRQWYSGIWIYSKRETAKKKKRLSFKTMAMRASFASTSLHSSTSFAYTHMTYANYPSFPGFRWKQKYCLLASLRVMSNFEHYTTVVLLCVVLKTRRCFTHKYSTSIRCTFNWLTENWHLRPRDLPGFYFLHEPTLLIRPGH